VGSRDPRRDRALLCAWLVAIFAASAASHPPTLVASWAVAAAVLRRGALRALRRVSIAIVPVAAGLSAASALWLRLRSGDWPDLAPFAALLLRATLAGFITFSVLERVNLPRALAPWATLSRLLALTLAQIHALRLLATESSLGLRSRLIRKPRAVDVIRGASGITASLFTLSMRNARDVSDAMRSRGF
jgi:cobalt/nickel transport system permease protein